MSLPLNHIMGSDYHGLSPGEALALYMKAHETSSQESTTELPVFYRNLEQALNERRNTSSFISFLPRADSLIDFCSNDVLSFNSSGRLRAEFLAELARHPEFSTGAGSSRALCGNEPYVEQLEAEIAAFHGAEAGHLGMVPARKIE